MADITLNPGVEPVPATTRLKEHRGEKTFFPADGEKFAVLYLAAAPGSAAAVKAKLLEAIALASDSQMIVGTATPDAGKRTGVHVQVTQLPNVPLE